MNRSIILFIILIGLIVIFVQTGQYDELKNVNNPHLNAISSELAHKKVQKRYSKIDENLKNITYATSLKINPTQSYNYLKKSEIYAIRNKYVKTSIFYTEDYEPSDIVFGQIEDNKPWYGLKYYNCAGSIKGTKEVTLGDSEESRFVNSPDILIGVDQGTYDLGDDYKNHPLCTERKYIIIPKEAVYSPKSNKITVRYKMPMKHYYVLNGINARDFGYEYIYAKSTKNIEFENQNNISNGIYHLENYIHTGGSCKVSGGCNNGSPNQPYLDFITKDNSTAIISLKLWRKKPANKEDVADINYDIIISTSKY